MRSLVLVLLAVLLLVAAGVIALYERPQRHSPNRLGLDGLRRIYRRDHRR